LKEYGGKNNGQRNGYYNFLKSGVCLADGLSILDTEHIIPFKAKAWLDLTERKAKGGQVDSKHIKKHKRDVIAMSDLLPASSHVKLPAVVHADLSDFIAAAFGPPYEDSVMSAVSLFNPDCKPLREVCYSLLSHEDIITDERQCTKKVLDRYETFL
jgi:hypothetical protein